MHALTSASLGKYLLAKVSAINSVTTSYYFTATSNQVTSAPTTVGSASISSKSLTVGDSATGVAPTWVAYPLASESSKWYRCDASVSSGTALGIGCTEITGATGSSYEVTSEDLGEYLVFGSFATNNLGSAVWYSASSELIESAPVQTSDASLSGFADVGDSLTAIEGTWYSYPAANLSYEWFTCDSAQTGQLSELPADCTILSGQVSANLAVTNQMLGKYLLAGITQSNINGSAKVYTPSSDQVHIPPKNVIAPFISGTARVSEQLVASSGTWDADPAPTFGYQWYLCDSAMTAVVYSKPADCSEIQSATDSSYTPTLGQAGKFIGLAITATNNLGFKEVFAISSGAVRTAPVVSAAPAFDASSSGLKPNANLVAGSGTWISWPTATFSYQWYDCASAETCILLDGSGSTYSANSISNGHTLKFKVTATNAEGSASSWSTSSVEIQQVPALASAGSISGNPYQGETLTLSASSFVGYPAVQTSRLWYACTSKPAQNAGLVVSGCTSLAESALSLSVLRSMQDKYLAVLEQASNANGTANVWVSTSATVSTLPQLSADPSISGTAKVSNNLTVSTGTWAASPSPTLSYSWYRCDTSQVASNSLGSNCSLVGTATNTYALTSADNGKYLIAKVTASNLVGAVSRYTASSAAITEIPANTVAPAVSGSALVGQVLTVSSGTWSGYPTPSYTYAWYWCTSQVFTSSASLPAGCSLVAGSLSTFDLTSAYAGKYVLVSVTASNSAGTSAAVFSASTGFVNQAPVNTVAPVISGTARVGSPLTVSNGSWSGTATIAYSYLWFSCTDSTAASATLPGVCSSTGAIGSSYTPTSASAGKYLVARVTASNAGGSAVHYSASTVLVTEALANTVAPSVSGSALVGQVLTVSSGTWSGYPTPSYTYDWYSCTSQVVASSASLPAGCTAISLATGSSFTLTSSQLNRYVLAAVTATNSAGSKPIWSASSAVVLAAVVNTVAPSYLSSNLVGEIVPGDTLTGSNGTWTGTPTPTYAYRWIRCDAAQNSSSSLPANCSAIAGEITNTYVVTDQDVSKYILFAVTATNSVSSSEVFSAGQTQVVQDITLLTEPSITSTVAGANAVVSSGNWDGYPAPTVDASYEICSVSHTSPYLVNGYDTCQLLANNGSNVTLPTNSTGKYLRLTLNVYNSRQNLVNVYTFGNISGAPAFAYQPTISGRPQIGQVSTVGDVNVWSYPASASLTYVWYSCAQQYSTAAQVQSSCTNVTQLSETTSHTVLASEAGRYQTIVVTANNGAATSSMAGFRLISPAAASDITAATQLGSFSAPPTCTGSTAYTCALNLGSSSFTKLIFASGSIGSVANLTGQVIFDQNRDQLTFNVTNSSTSAQRVDFNTMLTNFDGCVGTPNNTSIWVAVGETKSLTLQQATLGSFAVGQNCTFGITLNSMLVSWISLGKTGATTASAAVALDWPEGYFSNTCLMNVKTLQYSVCEYSTTVDMATGNDIAVATKITWNAVANTLSYSVTNNTGANVYIRLRSGTTGLCHLTTPASFTNELTVRSGNTYAPKATSVAAQTQYDFDSDAFFTAARSDCSITLPGTTNEFSSLVATISVSTVPNIF